MKDLVQIFPNPVVNRIMVHGKKGLRKPLLVQICDIQGRMLREAMSYQDNFSIDVADLKPGTYLLKLYNDYDIEVQVEKFIKQ